MKSLGYVLVVFGLMWTLWDEFSLGPLGRVQAEKNLRDLAADNYTSYTKQHVYAWMMRGEDEFVGRLPNFIWPCLVMAAGAVAIDAASRRAKRIEQGAR